MARKKVTAAISELENLRFNAKNVEEELLVALANVALQSAWPD